MSRKFANIVICLYSRASGHVGVYGELSKSLRTQSGVLPGCPLSPFLFNFVLDEIMRRTLEGLQNPGVQTSCDEDLVDLDFAGDIVLVFEEEKAQTPVTDEDGKTTDKVTAFIVERDFGGVTHSQPEEKMGIHASNTTALYFDDCKVPVENVLGQVGDGFKIAVNILNQGRFGMAAALSGTMRAAIQKTAQYVVQRKQFGRALNEFQNVQEKLANMTMRQYVAESMAFMIAGTMDLGAQDFQVEAAISKVYSSEAAWYCVDEAIQLHGGTGYMKHANLERVLRDLRVFRIFEGANDVLRLFIALTGLRYAGKHLAAARKSPVGIVRLGTQRLKQNFGFGAGHTLSNLVPASLISVGEELGDAIDLFGEECMLLLRKHGKDVIEEQFRLIRLADAIVEIYAMMCAVSRAAMAIQEHSQFAEHEVHLTNVVCQNVRFYCPTHLKRLFIDPPCHLRWLLLLLLISSWKHFVDPSAAALFLPLVHLQYGRSSSGVLCLLP
ncbi:very long chain acyl-CoA dehydrogenase [Clonorchis sinensis]|uniref:Very long chain acyl-CoA dehydrogenase n=1 Tax=Clonorchis sinensis TaxID=79923 RepID=G7Y635_CLOSI|nr:very long chain acyl-CoA dehydrogenase [Clonorchis sinensis]